MKIRLETIRTGLIVCAIAALTFANGQLFAQSTEKAGSAAKEATGSMAKEAHGSAAKDSGSAAKDSGSAAKDSGSMAKDSGSGAKAGSGGKAMMAETLGLEGYCPVCIVMDKGWVKGDPQIKSTFDHKTYYFPSAEVKQMFDADPVKFTPALGGDCTVCLKSLGKRVPGDIRFASKYKERLFLFPNEEVKQKFSNAPTDFADVDLASDGDCTVCTVELQEKVAGNPDFSTMHKGMRYLFPGVDQMNMFVANPAKYEVADPMVK